MFACPHSLIANTHVLNFTKTIPTNHKHSRIYLRSLPTTSRRLEKPLGPAGMGGAASNSCSVLFPLLSPLHQSLFSAGHTLAACPVPPSSPVQLFTPNFLPPVSSACQEIDSVSPKSPRQCLQLSLSVPRKPRTATPVCYFLAPHPRTSARWMCECPVTVGFSGFHLLLLWPEPVCPGKHWLPSPGRVFKSYRKILTSFF